ncbi:hypothetical protein [Vibrio viridaestus]|uniref:hypothetical protein n=1 Tax=Vibrio viridaestus TaxID=2487322 RepID=UPI00140E1CA5|nr:hypothetical protein [Vibrio viridaestus]
MTIGAGIINVFKEGKYRDDAKTKKINKKNDYPFVSYTCPANPKHEINVPQNAVLRHS